MRGSTTTTEPLYCPSASTAARRIVQIFAVDIVAVGGIRISRARPGTAGDNRTRRAPARGPAIAVFCARTVVSTPGVCDATRAVRFAGSLATFARRWSCRCARGGACAGPERCR